MKLAHSIWRNDKTNTILRQCHIMHPTVNKDHHIWPLLNKYMIHLKHHCTPLLKTRTCVRELGTGTDEHILVCRSTGAWRSTEIEKHNPRWTLSSHLPL